MQTLQGVRWSGQASASNTVQIMFSGRTQWELCYCRWRVLANEVPTEETAASGISLCHFPQGIAAVPKQICQIVGSLNSWAEKRPWFFSSVLLRYCIPSSNRIFASHQEKKQGRLINWLHKLMWHILRVGQILAAIYGLSLLNVLEMLWFVLGSVCPVLF